MTGSSEAFKFLGRVDVEEKRPIGAEALYLILGYKKNWQVLEEILEGRAAPACGRGSRKKGLEARDEATMVKSMEGFEMQTEACQGGQRALA